MGGAIGACCGSQPKQQSQPTKKILSSKYRKIPIQSLRRKPQPQPTPTPESQLVQQISKQDNQRQEQQQDNYYRNRSGNGKRPDGNVLWYRDTSEKADRILSSCSNFFGAFFQAYMAHGDVLLVPDDIWLMIMLFLGKYIESNAEKLRDKFVKFEGRKKLVVYEIANSVQQAQKLQKQWQYFFTEIISQIQENTVPGTVQSLSCNFTTTTPTHKLISTSILMSSFKHYFSYERHIMGCGINNVYFAGTREDWVKVHDKLMDLLKYDVNGQLKKYVECVEVILRQFLGTFDGKPDVKWWNQVMTSEERRVGSGIRSETFVEGWILHFYGIYHNVEIGKIPSTLVTVPVELKNKVTNNSKTLELRANWVSVSKAGEYIYQPDIGVCLVQKK